MKTTHTPFRPVKCLEEDIEKLAGEFVAKIAKIRG